MPCRLAALLACLVLAPAAASPAAVAPSSPPPSSSSSSSAPVSGARDPSARVDLTVTSFTLGNGLNVILHEDHRLPLVALNLWYHVGPAQEAAGRTGFAHLFEHMMFEGSKHVPANAHQRYLEQAGATDVNATTDFDRTNFFETVPANQLELALWLESDRMGYLLDTLDATKLANQRDVVRNERRETTEGEPYGLVEEELFRQLFPPGHPYRPKVIGSHADIEAARLADVREFARTYYTPSNASLSIAGDIDPAAARALVEKYFGSIPPGPALTPPVVPAAHLAGERRATVTDEVPLSRVYVAWHTPAAYRPGDAAADLAAQVLGGGHSGRLYKALVRQLALAQDVSVDNESLALGSLFVIKATARRGVTPERLLAAIDTELERFRRDGPTDAELARAKTTVRTDLIVALETVGGVADRLNAYQQAVHDPGYLPADLARYAAVTADEVRALAAEDLGPGSRAVVFGVPGRKAVADVPRSADDESAVAVEGRMADEAWRAAAPRAPAPGLPQLPVTTRFRLANGLSVLVAEQHALPVVSVAVIANAGSSSNPVALPGLAAFTAAMLTEGSRRHSADELADRAAALGTALHAVAGRDSAAVEVTVLSDATAAATALLAEVVREPRFAPADVEHRRSLRDGTLRESDSDPSAVARHVLVRALYGSDSPYGYPDNGTRAANARIRAQDLVHHWQTHYRPASAALVLAGDITPDAARALAQRAFGDWHGAPPPPPGPRPAYVPHPALYLVDRPGLPQSALAIGGPGEPRATPAYVPLEITNNVLGGLFSSRLNLNLREAHGYTYGAQTWFQYSRDTGFFNLSSQVRTDATAAALGEALKELERMRTVPPSAAELDLARGAFAESLAGLFEGSQSSAMAAAELFLYDLPDDYFATLAARSRAVTERTVVDVANAHLEPGGRKIVIVGDGAKVRASLAALKLGPLVEVDELGNPRARRRQTPAGAKR